MLGLGLDRRTHPRAKVIGDFIEGLVQRGEDRLWVPALGRARAFEVFAADDFSVGAQELGSDFYVHRPLRIEGGLETPDLDEQLRSAETPSWALTACWAAWPKL